MTFVVLLLVLGGGGGGDAGSDCIGEDDDECVSSKLDCVSLPVDMLFKKLSWLKTDIWEFLCILNKKLLQWQFFCGTLHMHRIISANSSKVDK